MRVGCRSLSSPCTRRGKEEPGAKCAGLRCIRTWLRSLVRHLEVLQGEGKGTRVAVGGKLARPVRNKAESGLARRQFQFQRHWRPTFRISHAVEENTTVLP